jgi:hypothetical protein
LQVFLILNVALAGAFVVYLFLSTSRQPKVVATSFAASNKTNAPAAAAPRTNTPPAATNLTLIAPTNLPAVADITPAKTKPTPASKKFSWQDVESPDYPGYIENLRVSGCPEEKVRYIVLADIADLFAQKRVKEAVAHDIQWWRSEPERMLVNVLQERGRALEEERRELITKLLGAEIAAAEKSEATFWNSVQLTGPVLGNLPADRHAVVQEICAKSMERHQAVFWQRANEGQPLNQVEMAKLREQTRADLRPVINNEEMEEFLLRYSHNAHRLRDELRGVDPTPDEFRKIFRATDAIDHQLQLEYGGPEALGEKQRERYERQRTTAIQEALGPERHLAYLQTKDPLYRQAQMYAMQYGAPSKAVMPIYEMTKANESKRQKIINDAALTPQQKSIALQAVNQEQAQFIQKIVVEAAASR